MAGPTLVNYLCGHRIIVLLLAWLLKRKNILRLLTWEPGTESF